MSDESAYERQYGPVPRQRPVQVIRGILEPEWLEAWDEFQRLLTNGLSEAAAVQCFSPLLSNPALRDAAEFVIDYHSARKPAEQPVARKPSERFEAGLKAILDELPGGKDERPVR